MKRIVFLLGAALVAFAGNRVLADEGVRSGSLALASENLAQGKKNVVIDGMFYETKQGRVLLPLTELATNRRLEHQFKMPDGRTVKLSVKRDDDDYLVNLRASEDADITKWGFAIRADNSEYFTGLMERVVDGRQQASWAPGIKEGMDLRGQKVDMILKPTTSVYAPFYLSSIGYAVFVQGDWPGYFDFCSDDPQRVKVEFEGASFAVKIYTAKTPAELVKAHAADAGLRKHLRHGA